MEIKRHVSCICSEDRFSRFARSTQQLCAIIDAVWEKHLRLVITGRLQTTRDDIPAVFLRHDPTFRNGQLNISELARACDLSRTTVYKYIGLLEG